MPEQNADAVLDPEMLRRAAEACRNIKKQTHGPAGWFDWVATYLDDAATGIGGSGAPDA